MVRKAMIMAAGVGSRLEPLTQVIPKPLIPIANISVMEILLKKLYSDGIKEIIANTYCLAEQIHNEFSENNFGVNFNYIQEKELSGTAGGVKKCQQFFDGEKTFLVMSADGLTGANLKEIIQSHKKSGAIATMGLKEIPVKEVSHFGVVVTDEKNRVIEFQEKPSIAEAKSNLVNTGIYVFEKEIFDYIPADTFYDFARNVFPALMDNNETINTFVIKEYWSDIGTIEQYKQSSWDVLNGLVNIGIDFAPNQNVFIGENCTIENGVKFEGYAVIGNNCTLKKGCKIKNSILWDNVTVKNDVIIGDSVISDNNIIENNKQSEIIGQIFSKV
ncbi:MAG: NDP-sugar synthase [Candidatus Gastranaerophilales bacterium]|nr:NDP-sugar synthase [Candidatus Gastranaerophilales bacterium]